MLSPAFFFIPGMFLLEPKTTSWHAAQPLQRLLLRTDAHRAEPRTPLPDRWDIHRFPLLHKNDPGASPATLAASSPPPLSHPFVCSSKRRHSAARFSSC
jgi:hypothetical protein